MRIRQHASLILGTVNNVAFSSSLCYPILPPPLPHGDTLQPCTVNYSSWDLINSTPPSPQPQPQPVGILYKRMFDQAVAGASGDGQENSGTRIKEMKSNAHVLDDDQKNHELLLIKGEKKKKNEEGCGHVSAIILCKKNDGKRWSCKRQALYPHALCEYHLNLNRSYHTNLLSMPTKKKKKKKKKPRNERIKSTQREIKQDEVKMESLSKDASCCQDNSFNGAQGEICTAYKTVAHMKINCNPPKWKRKRIKARSLKSLL